MPRKGRLEIDLKLFNSTVSKEGVFSRGSFLLIASFRDAVITKPSLKEAFTTGFHPAHQVSSGRSQNEAMKGKDETHR